MKMTGFTLIEMMIVVVIIGVLAGIAYPSYQKYTRETRRSDGQIALSRLANDLEKFFSECGKYTQEIKTSPRSCTAPAGGTLGRGAGNDFSPNRYYQLSIVLSGGGSGYTLTAVPQAIQASDTECANLTLTSAGVAGATGTNTARCWRK